MEERKKIEPSSLLFPPIFIVQKWPEKQVPRKMKWIRKRARTDLFSNNFIIYFL